MVQDSCCLPGPAPGLQTDQPPAPGTAPCCTAGTRAHGKVSLGRRPAPGFRPESLILAGPAGVARLSAGRGGAGRGAGRRRAQSRAGPGHGGEARVALVLRRPGVVRGRLLHPPARPAQGAPADAAGGEGAHDGHGAARGALRRGPGALQRAQRLAVPADDLLPDPLCHLRDGAGPPGPGQPGPAALLPEGAAGRRGRFHGWVCGDPGGHGECQDAERHEAAGAPEAQLRARAGWDAPRAPGGGPEEAVLRRFDGFESGGPGHRGTALLLRPGQAAGPHHRAPVRQHLHPLPGQLHRRRMRHIPVPALGRAQDPPDELPGRVPGRPALRRGDGQAGATGFLQGLCACCHPAGPAHRPHLRLPGAAAQVLRDQSAGLSRGPGQAASPLPAPLACPLGRRLPQPPQGHCGPHPARKLTAPLRATVRGGSVPRAPAPWPPGREKERKRGPWAPGAPPAPSSFKDRVCSAKTSRQPEAAGLFRDFCLVPMMMWNSPAPRPAAAGQSRGGRRSFSQGHSSASARPGGAGVTAEQHPAPWQRGGGARRT